jgi:hypothetical protein
MNDLEMNLDLSTSEMADINGGHRIVRNFGEAQATALAGAFGQQFAETYTNSYSEHVGGRHGYALASSESDSYAK